MPPLLLLFFASGACGLVYEVVWMRLLTLTLSVTVHAVTTVLAAFMAGLALGAAWGGRVADRVGRPLAAYALVELGLAATGAATPAVLFRLPPVYVWLHDRLGGSALAFGAATDQLDPQVPWALAWRVRAAAWQLRQRKVLERALA